MISETQQMKPSTASVLDAASISGAHLNLPTTSLDRPGFPNCGEPGRPLFSHQPTATRSSATACTSTTRARIKLSPTAPCLCEVINYPRAVEAPTRSKNPALQGRVLVAQTDWSMRAFIRTEPLSVPTCHVATGRR